MNEQVPSHHVTTVRNAADTAGEPVLALTASSIDSLQHSPSHTASNTDKSFVCQGCRRVGTSRSIDHSSP